MIGTIINVVAILSGGGVGLILGSRLPEKTRQTVISGLGIMVLVVGFKMALRSNNIIIVLISILLGGIFGEWLRIEDHLHGFGRMLESRFSGLQHDTSSINFVRGFVTASLIFCIGPMAILGSISDGLMGDYSLLVIKSVLDAFAAMAFSATMGFGVLFASFSVLIYQGAISLLAIIISSQLIGLSAENPAILEMSATGGVLIVGIGLLLLDLREMRIGNFLPAIFIAPLIVSILGIFHLL